MNTVRFQYFSAAFYLDFSDFVRKMVDDAISEVNSNKLLCALLLSQVMKAKAYKAWFEVCLYSISCNIVILDELLLLGMYWQEAF